MAEQRVTGQRLSDDVLDHWASEAAKELPGKLGSIDLPAVVGMLIAELRASRAREAELAAEVETWQGRCSADQDNMTRFRRRAVAAEAERDVLQQCIDKALAITYASDDGTKYTHAHRRGEGEPECPACWAHDVRTALAGAETASSDSGGTGTPGRTGHGRQRAG